MKQAPFRIVQISDMHLFADDKASLLGVKTQESFTVLLDLLRVDKIKPNIILLTGDLSQDGTEASYIKIADQLAEFRVPVYCVPGNHDDAKVMAHIYPRDTISAHRHIILQHWHIIMLDSQKPKNVDGYLDRAQLNYLQHCLQTYPEHHAIIAFHHQPLAVGSPWLDKLGLSNSDELWRLLAGYPRVNTILFGHVHQQHESKLHGVNCYGVPSTCIQFKTKSDEFALDRLPPAYRWMDLYPDGRLTTGICQATEYVGHFAANATGY